MHQLWHREEEKDIKGFMLLVTRWMNLKKGFWKKSGFQNKIAVAKERIEPLVKAARGGLNNWTARTPSAAKKAASLVVSVIEHQPLQPVKSGVSEEDVRLANAVFAWELAFEFVNGAEILGEDNVKRTVNVRPEFPSLHTCIECCEYAADKKLSQHGIALIIETLVYAENPRIAGCKDGSALKMLGGLYRHCSRKKS